MPTEQRQSTSRLEISRESTGSFSLLGEALRRDRGEAWREILLWQRWVRYAIVAALAAATLLFGVDPARQSGWTPLILAASAYLILTAAVGWYLRWRDDAPVAAWLPSVVVVSDVLVVATLIYLSSPPADTYRILLLGLLVLQMAVFYFGLGPGSWAAAASLVAYVAIARALPPVVDGARPTLFVVGYNAILFAFAMLVVLLVFGRFRERMERFRTIVKRAELGDQTGTYEHDRERLPDDLTIVARSFTKMRGRLVEMIGTDPLTGCLNRRAFATRLNREWRAARRRGSTLALLAIDTDYFKQINDTHGHVVGDAVLQGLGEIMQATARETDAVARFGGDEFVVLLPDTAWQGAMTFAERLRRHVTEHPFAADGTPFHVTISIGVAVAAASDDLTPEHLLEEADRTLYRAKSEGRNRICA